MLVIAEKSVVVSGCDFRNLSVIKATKSESANKWKFDVQRVDVTSDFVPDAEMLEVVKGASDLVTKQLSKVIGKTGIALDALNASVRTKESNLGNLISDIMRLETGADTASINGGNIRSDNIYEPGDITLNNLVSILPYDEIVVKIVLNGKKYKEFLEAAVGRYPNHDGRFAQVSGVKFGFDPDKPEGNRVQWIEINNKPIQDGKEYSLALVEYIALGNDGYECLKGHPMSDKENGVMLSTMVRRHFMKKKVLQAMDENSSETKETALGKFKGKNRSSHYTVKPTVENLRSIMKRGIPAFQVHH